MIKVTIEPRLQLLIPKLKLGIVQAKVIVSRHNDELWREIDCCVSTISKYDMESLYHVEGIEALREGYKAIGKDPSRYRGSAEALARRITTTHGKNQSSKRGQGRTDRKAADKFAEEY